VSTLGSWIETVPWQSAQGVLEEAYNWQAKRLGQPAEFTMLGSLYPDLVMERLRLYKVVEATPSALTPLERLIAAYVTSTLNHTPHCSSGLLHKLEDTHAPAEVLEQVRSSPLSIASGDERLDAVVVYAAKLTVSPGRVDQDDISRLRRAGLRDLDILDLNNIVSYYNYINRVANGLGLRSEISADHAWRAVPR
jgi:uncharacterized peroxidase-related enzyme